jgi:hypothetical protein
LVTFDRSACRVTESIPRCGERFPVDPLLLACAIEQLYRSNQ